MFVPKAFAAVFAAVGLLVQSATGMFAIFSPSDCHLVDIAGLKHIRRRETLYRTLAMSTML